MSVFGKARRRGRNRDGNRTTRPFVELFEDRTLLSGVVMNTNDSGADSLRAAIDFANLNPGTKITFEITTGPFVIHVGSTTGMPLPAITAANTTVDGLSQGALVTIDGTMAGTSADGLILKGINGAVDGLEIVNFGGAGIHVESTGARVTANLIGTDGKPNHTTLGNNEGVFVDGANGGSGAVIGGTTPADANTIGFNKAAGVSISGAGATGNVVIGNFIGTDTAGDDLHNLVGVSISTSGNTVGQDGAGNTIAFNTGDAVDVASGNGNAIRQNLIYGNGGDIVLTGSANDSQISPSVQHVASVSGLTTIDFTVTPNTTAGSNKTYTVDFFANSPSSVSPIAGPAYAFLGEASVTVSGTTAQEFTALLTTSTTPLISPVPAGWVVVVVPAGAPTTSINAGLGGQKITATVTDPDHSTSEFDTTEPTPTPSPFKVTNPTDETAGSAVGSLRAAILNSNFSPGQTNAITFALPGPLSTISPAAALPTITVPVTMNGNGAIKLDGSKAGATADGLTLGTGSGGSTITGQDIVAFGGAGIDIQSNGNKITDNWIGTDTTGLAAGPGNGIGVSIAGANNTVGPNAAGAANTIGFNAQNGVEVLSGGGNVISQNLYTGTNGSTPPVEANDITNPNQAAPKLSGSAQPVSQTNNTTTIKVFVSVPNVTAATSVTLEFYLISSTPNEREFLGSAQQAGLNVTSPVTFVAQGIVTNTASIIATAKTTAGGTSPFSNSAVFASPLTVTTTEDNPNDPGSLRAVIAAVNANSSGANQVIVFAIPQDPNSPGGPFTITLDPTYGALPSIMVGHVTIDATTQFPFGNNNNNQPVVVIDGSKLGGTPDGLTLQGGNGTVTGLEIVNFKGDAISIQSDNNTITGDVITSNPGNAVDVVSGSGDAIRQNLIYSNGGDIVLAADANDKQTGPTIQHVSSVAGLTTIDFTATPNTAAGIGQKYTVDFYANSPSSVTPTVGPAYAFLGTAQIQFTGTTAQEFTAVLATGTLPQGALPSDWIAVVPAGLPSASIGAGLSGQEITATVTDSKNSTSVFDTAEPEPTPNPFTVTNTTDEIPGMAVGSLRVAILNSNFDPPTPPPSHPTNLIDFKIPGPGTLFTIEPLDVLPTIIVPVQLDGNTERQFLGNTSVVVQIDGSKIPGATIADGLILGVGSDFSTIAGMEVLNFNDIGINVASSNNTIGGTDAGAGNTLGSNTLAGILIGTGTSGNTVEGNNIGTIPATVTSQTPGPSPTIAFNLNGTGGLTYTVSFYASPPVGTTAPPQFLGTYTADFTHLQTGVQPFTVTLHPAEPLLGGWTVTGFAIATIPATVTLTTSVPNLTTVNFSLTGTVGQAYKVSFYASPPAGSTQPQFLGTFSTPPLTSGTQNFTATFDLATPLQSSQTVTGVAAALSNGYGVQIVNSNKNTIGGNDLSAGNTIGFSAFEGVAILSGTGNQVLRNTYAGSNGLSTFVPADDIAVAPGANNTPPAVQLLGSVFGPLHPSPGAASNTLFVTLQFSPSLLNNPTGIGTVTFDFYTDDESAAPGTRTFLASTDPLNFTTNASSPGPVSTNQPFTVGISVPSTFGLATEILVTATFSSLPASASDGTSAFSNEIDSTTPTVVYITDDSSIPSVSIDSKDIEGIAGSLRYAISYANSFPSAGSNTSIGFNIPTTDPGFDQKNYIIDLATELPSISTPVDLDGTSQPGFAGIPLIELNGGGHPFDGLTLDTGSAKSTIEGLVIAQFNGAGIDLLSGSNTVGGNFIGTEAGADKLGNVDGIDILSSSNSITGNTVGFNSGSGIAIIANANNASITGNNVVGNDIGTFLSNAGATPSYVNVGNNKAGILIEATDADPTNPSNSNPPALGATVTGNNITGNIIGYNAIANSSTTPIGGIEIEGSQLNTSSSIAATNNVIAGNMIGGIGNGTGPDGRTLIPTPVGNKGPGILLMTTGTNVSLSGNVIGGAATATGATGALTSAANDIWDNAGDGVEIKLDGDTESTSVANTVEGNAIALNFNGVHLIGDLTGRTSLGEIASNYIGTDPTGSYTFDPKGNPWGNALSGVLLEQAGTAGGGTPVSVSVTGNVMSGNGLSGVTVQQFAGGALKPSPTALVSISGNILGLDKTGTQAVVYNTLGGVALPMGNALDGVLLDNVVGVTVGGTGNPGPGSGNVISGNLGRGIEVRGDLLNTRTTDPATGAVKVTLSPSAQLANVIQGNYIGTDISGQFGANVPPVPPGSQAVTTSYTLGNLSDGVFLFDPANTKVLDNVISNNRAAGVHAATDVNEGQPSGGSASTASVQTMTGNSIGTNAMNNAANSQNAVFKLSNGSDGIFIDSLVPNPGSTLSPAVIEGNVISGNRSNGIDLLDSSAIMVSGNMIGTDQGGSRPDLGNSANGIFLNGSGSIAISNSIGASLATAGDVISGNIVSGNLSNGILLANKSLNNLISGNKIGTDATGTGAVPNSADGIFLLGGQATINGKALGGTVTGTVISGNTISGNNEHGVEIFGPGAAANAVVNNTIGGSATMSGTAGGVVTVPPGNGANGVYLNDDGGSNVIGPGNVISGNAQSGVLIFGTEFKGGHDSVVGNKIGTDSAGSYAVPNGGNGVFIYGAPNNTIGGMAGTPGPGGGIGNLISGNAQAGVSIFSPADTAFGDGNLVAGNLIGTDLHGIGAIPNRADGVDIYSARNNTIGNAAGATGGLNVISGNQFNGILIAKLSNVDSIGNLVNQNDIGTNANGTSILPNGKDGVLVQNAYGNSIGGASSGAIPNVKVPAAPSNVISGNLASGVEFSDLAEGTLPGNTVQGNFIGVSKDGTGSLGNVFAGIFVNNLGGFSSNEQIGGTGAGTGNIIGGSAGGYGVDIVGPVTDTIPANNAVQGNLIGLDVNGNPVGNGIGVYLQNSWGNLIGGSGDARNVISANAQAGVELTGLYSTRNTIGGNFIGTDLTGTQRPDKLGALTGVPIPSLQIYGVYITTPSPTFDPRNKLPNNQILSNLISGNLIGINITGVGSGVGTGSGVPFGRDIIAGNTIGTDPSGNAANPNFEYGVYIDNSAANTVGGTGTGAGNLISANGVDGVEIIGGTPQTKSPKASHAAAARNMIIGNVIGYNSAGGPGFTAGGGASVPVPDGPTVVLGQQLYGVVVIGSSSNIIGGKGQGNVIGGNTSAGVYITVQDFNGNIYSTPTNNTLNSNTIANNGQYGVYRFESQKNSVAERPQRYANKFSGNPINLADYLKGVGVNTLPAPKSRFLHKAHHKPAKVAHPRKPKHHATRHGHPGVSTPARPRIPALFHPGVKTVRIEHVPARRHR